MLPLKGKAQIQPFSFPHKVLFNLTQPPHTKGDTMEQIPDDPIVACMLRTGWPPWMLRPGDDDDGMDQD